jgi:hypothetical protein
MIKPREIAYCALFGAAALLLPVFFHLFHLGHIFMPMYLPLVALAFYVMPLPAALTSLIIPLLSGAVTGMPPFYPPIAPIMSLELSFMALVIGVARAALPRVAPFLILLPALMMGRVLGVGLVYLAAKFMTLPAPYLAGVSFISGWPGIILMLIAIPLLIRITSHGALKAPEREKV